MIKQCNSSEDLKEKIKLKRIPITTKTQPKFSYEDTNMTSNNTSTQLETSGRFDSPLKRVPRLKLPFKMIAPIEGRVNYSPQPKREGLSNPRPLLKPSSPKPKHPTSSRKNAMSPRTFRFVAKASPQQHSPPRFADISKQSEMQKAFSSKKVLNQELWDASASGNKKILLKLLDTENIDKIDINSTGLENRTALHWAVYENKLDSVSILLQFGANIEAKTDKQRTPLHIACILGQEEICKILLKSNCNIDSQDKENNTPCHYASYYNNFTILSMLLSGKPDITLKNNSGLTAIDCTSNKTIITAFWKYLTEKLQDSEEIKKEGKIEKELVLKAKPTKNLTHTNKVILRRIPPVSGFH